ncbi:MAG: hypothetical protein KGJ23_03345 [Euryarchaeota archaeon]|nr:hypothetical protein [Euryarchaeota archaeon]MDE1835634.1 hypothetical protein [Euryarchaeota archaeon]MDE1878982.1 hypothetical protein [Euryarchaeota archaeon]MDE2043744.1 hypothetical protein [Thermoplasmata archaeon]
MPADSTLPATAPPAPLALPFTARDARREQLQREYEEAVARLRRVRQYRFVIYGEVRRCLAVLGDQASELVGGERYEELKRESEMLSTDPVPIEGMEGEEPLTDPALAWMEPESLPEAVEGPPSLPPAPSSEETGHAARTLRECLEYLDAADRSIPEFHVAILQAEARLKELGETPTVAVEVVTSPVSPPPTTAPPASTS